MNGLNKEKVKAGEGGWVRTGVSVALLMWVVMIVVLIVAVIRDATLGYELAVSKDLMAPTVAATGVVIAVMAFIRDRSKIARDRADARSKIMYEQCKQGLESVLHLLQDGNNDRIIWIRAARTLLSVKELSRAISSDDYRLAYELAEDDHRARLYEILSYRRENEPERHALPPAFFFGLKNWRDEKASLDDLAIKTSGSVFVHAVSESSNVPERVALNLDCHSVKVIMGFLDYRVDYIDLLDKIDWENLDGWTDSRGPKQGAYRYLNHKKRKTALNGKLFDRKASDPASGAAP